jgi:hypothetical protein
LAETLEPGAWFATNASAGCGIVWRWDENATSRFANQQHSYDGFRKLTTLPLPEHERSPIRAPYCATVAPQSTPIEGGYRPL